MTTSLTVFTKLGDRPDQFKVFWACGRNTQGVVNVTMACTTEKNEVAAELSALQYLLEVREVCGADRAGNSLAIVCSSGAIRKLAAGKSDKQSLVPFALFLRTRFADAEIAVSKDDRFIAPVKANNHSHDLLVEQPTLSTMEFPDGLRVGITHHALSAYMIRYQVPLAANAWRSLRAAVSHPRTRLQVTTSEEISRHGKTVCAYVTPDGLRLIVVHEKGGPRLLTCYYSRFIARQEMQLV